MADVRAGKVFLVSKIVTEDDVSLQVDGINVVLTLSANYVPGTVKIYLNGLRQQKGSGKDYDETLPNQVTFVLAPEVNDIAVAEYIKA